MPVGREDNNVPEKGNNGLQMDYSLLSSFVTKNDNSKKVVTASNKDAEILMDIWLKANKKTNEKTHEEVFNIDELKLSSQDVLSLKTRGLITGGTSDIKFTGRGKTVITTMALSENNGFLKNQKSKSYTEIMASTDKRGKKGYRIPKYATNSNLIDLTHESN